jgi:ubiquinone/menaquinone biosynthesis C-methylase UbiE
VGTVEQNRHVWGSGYAWPQAGEEWSRVWGGSAAQWHGALLPRLRPYLPVRTLLEIAPGHGRWTNYLADHCERLIAVDVADSCVEACTKRFADRPHIEVHRNDGRSLPMVADASVDLVFSFDSLVHVEADVLGAYLSEFARVLAPDGVAFIHHSNLGEFRALYTGFLRLPSRVRRAAVRTKLVDGEHWRALSVSASEVDRMCDERGLVCLAQELVNWGGRRLIDCFSLIARPGSSRDHPKVVVRNSDFMAEARSIRCAAEAYLTLD